MKRIFLALLAVVAMVGCNENLEETQGIATKFDFAFDVEGVCYSKSTEGITDAEFAEMVVGYGWENVSTYEIFANGNISTKDYWDYMIGGAPVDLYFESDKVLRIFQYLDGAPGGLENKYGYWKRDIIFDSSRIIFDGDRSRYKYLILTVSDDTMVCISKQSKGYHLVTFKRMTAEELETKLQKYHRDWWEVHYGN